MIRSKNNHALINQYKCVNEIILCQNPQKIISNLLAPINRDKCVNEIILCKKPQKIISNLLIIPLGLLALALSCSPLHAGNHEGHQTKAGAGGHGTGQAPAFATMPGPGKKVSIGNGAYLIYGFDKKPKMGTIIMKVEVYTPAGKPDTSLEVLADSGMPSMRGAHETGDQPFKLSRKGEYMLPVNIVMPGDWEIRLSIKKAGKVIFRGSHRFDV